MREPKVWSMDVAWHPRGWTVRRTSIGAKTLGIYPTRRAAIERAMNIKTAFYVFVYTRYCTLQYVKRTKVRTQV